VLLRFIFVRRRRLSSPLFPYTTLFRSDAVHVSPGDRLDPGLVVLELVVGQVVGDQGRELHGDVEGRLEPAGEAEDELLLGEGERSEEHTSELQSPYDLVCRLLLEKKKQ